MPNYDDSDRFHSRKNPRLKQYDYSSHNYYFVTICTNDKRCLFGDPGRLNSYGKIAEQGIREIEFHFPNVKVEKYVVMPNHIHAIILLERQDTNLSTVIGQYKSFVSKQIHLIDPERKVWQTSFHDHVIRDQKGFENIWLYIEANPSNWKKDCFYTI